MPLGDFPPSENKNRGQIY